MSIKIKISHIIVNYVGKLRQWHLLQIVRILWDSIWAATTWDLYEDMMHSQSLNCQLLFSHSPALLIVLLYQASENHRRKSNQITKATPRAMLSANFINVYVECGQCLTEIASMYVDVCAWIKKLNRVYYFTNVSSWKKTTSKNIHFMIIFHGKTVTSRANKKAFLPSTSNMSETREEKRIK